MITSADKTTSQINSCHFNVTFIACKSYLKIRKTQPKVPKKKMRFGGILFLVSRIITLSISTV